MGTVEAAGRFAAAWTAGTGLSAELAMRQRFYTLDGLRPPEPPPPAGRGPAGPADLELVMDWLTRFHEEAEASAAMPQREIYQRRIELGLAVALAGRAGEPVSMACRNVTVAGVSRIGPVYTPPACPPARLRSGGHGGLHPGRAGPRRPPGGAVHRRGQSDLERHLPADRLPGAR